MSARLWVACLACVSPLLSAAPAGAQEPAYQIVLRSRSGEVTPHKEKDGRTGGGSIEVVQREPDTVLVLMRGAVVAAAEREKGGLAQVEFILHQDFEIVPKRQGLRPARLSLAGLVTGTLQSVGKAGGNAEEGPAVAAVTAGNQAVLEISLPPHFVSCGQGLFVNDRQGPVEALVAPGCYSLHQNFALHAEQPWDWCHHLGSGVGAVFDPDPRLAARWGAVLRPFRGVPHQDFGFGVVLRVEEEPVLPPAQAEKNPPGGGLLPPPHPLPDKKGVAQ
jgi:hypothetical protein